MARSRKKDTVDESELKPVVNWLNSLREKNSLTQNDFANQIGVSTTYVNMLSQGKRKPSLQLLRRVADMFKDTSTLRAILPRAYDETANGRNIQHVSSEVLQLQSPISSLFTALNHQHIVSSVNVLIEDISDRSLEAWGVYGPSVVLSEYVEQTDLTAGDLVVYGEPNRRKWGFIHVVDSKAFIISGGYHLSEVLRHTEEEWIRSGLHHLEINRYLLSECFEATNVCKVRLIVGTPPNLRTPIVSHPNYQFLKPEDRRIVDQVIAGFTGYAKGSTEYQPSQHKRKF